MDGRHVGSSLENPVLLFDGVCNLCNASVQWLIRRDNRSVFRFAALQSAVGADLLRRAGLTGDLPDSVVLVEDGRCLVRSDAALRICTLLGGWWRLLGIFRIVPRRLRDGVYDRIAGKRYAWFGRQESCWLPTPALRERFLDAMPGGEGRT